MIDVFDIIAFAVFAILLVTVVLIVVELGALPGKLARKWGHPQARVRPAPAARCSGPHGLLWTRSCFPPSCCPDDYCPNPYPRQCQPPYPPFYRCVPAGDCGDGHAKGRLTWWFLPTPQALREALRCKP